jgi:hypothetical protein
MRIINHRTNAVLAENAALADKFWPRLRGLLGKKDLRSGEALVLRPCNSIHTFFMRFNIDVIFVNRKNIVVKCLSCLKPFQLTPIYFSSALAIELPPGTIAASSTCPGDTLVFS